jgi:hypothetical protein
MARPIAVGYGEGIFTDSQTWGDTVASTGETTLGNISVPDNEQWNIYSVFCSAYGGLYRLDCTGVAAAATAFSFSGPATVGSTITLVSQDGTKKTYICVAESGSALDGVVSDGKVQFEAGASTGAHAAVHFKAAVEHANGHENKITATLSTAEVTLSQDVVGVAGNTTIAHSGTFTDSITEEFVPNQFTGGTDGLSSLVGKFVQNDANRVAADDELREMYFPPYETDIWIQGPCTLTMYVTNSGSSSTTCKGQIQYIRHIATSSYPIYDENGEMDNNE